jgi:hypothetical protein
MTKASKGMRYHWKWSGLLRFSRARREASVMIVLLVVPATYTRRAKSRA